MRQNELAALPGRQGGGDLAEGVLAYHHEDQNAESRDRTISDPQERWLDRVEITAPTGVAGSTDRKIAAAIIASLPPGRDAFAIAQANLGRRAGVGVAGTAAALRRLVARGLIAVDAQAGRGLWTWIVVRMGRR